MKNDAVCAHIDDWLKLWDHDPLGGKKAFQTYYAHLNSAPDVVLEFNERPSISYSLRARHTKQEEGELFVLVDVVDDEPEARWLSVCFYASMVSDPQELGDFVPQGLLGSDALCLNLEDDDADMEIYIFERIKEALAATLKKYTG